MKVTPTLLMFFLALFLLGCSSAKPTGKTEAEVLYKEAIKLKDNGNYLLATERLNLIKSKFPYSFYAVPAELLLADILFLQENYVEAAAAYLLFKDFHPKHKKRSYVIWKIAESYYNQRPSTYDRDLEPAINAIQYYEELLRLFPGSPYSKDAESKIEECQKLLENKEKYIADFYFRTESFNAARIRYLSIVEDFTDKELIEKSIIRIIECSVKLNEKKGCIKYYNRFKGKVSKATRSKLNDLCRELD